MKSYEERLKIVLRFLEEDVETLRAGALQDLQEDLATLIQGSPRDWTIPLLKKLQNRVRDVIDLIAAHNIREVREQIEEEHVENFLFPPGRPNSCVWWSYQNGHFIPRLPSSVQQATVDVSTPLTRFLWELCVMLSQVEGTRVRICWPEECGRYFFADHGNQWFCSPKCVNRAKAKRYRQASEEQKSG